MVGVKRGRGKWNLGERERVGRAREKGEKPRLPPPSRAVSRPNSLPFPFRTPSTQVILDRASFHMQGRWFRRDFFNGAKLCRSDLEHQYCRHDVIWNKTTYTHSLFLSRKRESQVVYTQVDVKLLNPGLIGIFSIKWCPYQSHSAFQWIREDNHTYILDQITCDRCRYYRAPSYTEWSHN